MASEELDKQIEQEHKEIENAPKVPLSAYQTGVGGRCHWCGKPSTDLVLVETVGNPPIARYKGRDCCGFRHI